MSWFKREENNLIPPVTETQSTGDDIRERYHRNTPVDAYSRGQGDVDSDRNALFSSYNPEKVTGRIAHENEEDIEAIKKQTRFIKQDSLSSRRNALRLAREAEETARGTINRLGSQSEKLANTERHLDVAKGHSQRADDRTGELKQLNYSIFRPVITFNKDAKRAAQEVKVLQRYEEEREEHEKAMGDIRETQNRLGQASTYGSREEDIGAGPNGRRAAQPSLQKEQRKRYQFEASASDDELEDELDDNLDGISDVAQRLKALGAAMGQELDHQNNRIERIEEKTVCLDNRVFRNTERVRHSVH
ncbi:protein transporter SEC9 [Lactarius akahatsu]|uniref:Protein transporter SEC9 n=1 Tax=Lactarius akahatsu TaxID=416441 RepID=A0AAD4LHL8_9AGAM|nr:protein transporter SEC9 [Lactarius akahatsu]